MNTKHCILHTSHYLQHIVHYNSKLHFLIVRVIVFLVGLNRTEHCCQLYYKPAHNDVCVCTLYKPDIQNKASERLLHCLLKTKKNRLPVDAMNASKNCLFMGNWHVTLFLG